MKTINIKPAESARMYAALLGVKDALIDLIAAVPTEREQRRQLMAVGMALAGLAALDAEGYSRAVKVMHWVACDKAGEALQSVESGMDVHRPRH